MAIVHNITFDAVHQDICGLTSCTATIHFILLGCSAVHQSILESNMRSSVEQLNQGVTAKCNLSCTVVHLKFSFSNEDTSIIFIMILL